MGSAMNQDQEFLTLMRRMHDLFERCDPNSMPPGTEPYTDQEWDELRAEVRRTIPELNLPGPRRLVIMSCSATKRPDPGYMPARDRYNGPLWQTLRAADPEGTRASVAFLSAQYGFREASSPIEKYEAKMTPERAAQMILGSTYTRWPRPKSWKRPDSGDHANMHILRMTEDGQLPFTEVALVGGALYLDVMRSFVTDFQAMHCITPGARIVEINDSIGLMRNQLRAWLTA